jgi:hypothetical protein
VAELIGAPAAVGRRSGTGLAGARWDHRAFDAIDPLRRPGSGAFRRNWTRMLSVMPRSAVLPRTRLSH